MLDTDGDGIDEIVTGNADMWYLLEWDFERAVLVHRYSHGAWNNGFFGPGIIEIAPGDVDADGRPEIVVLSDGGSVRWYDAATGTQEGAVELGLTDVWSLAVGEVDPSPGDELVVLDYRGDVRVYQAGSVTPLYVVSLVSIVPFGNRKLAIGNVDDDPQNEIVADAAFGSAIDSIGHYREFTGFIGEILLGDVDGDQIDEIVALGWTTYVYFPLWDDFLTLNVPGLLAGAVADIDGDGRAEILAVRSNELKIFDGSTVAQQSSYSRDYTGTEALAVGDFDGDCEIELVAVGRRIDVVDLSNNLDGVTILPAKGHDFGLAIGDVDGDGRSELAHLYRDSLDGFVNLLVEDLHHRRTEMATTVGSTFSSPSSLPIALGQLDGDPQLEVFVYVKAASSYSVQAHDGLTLTMQWQSTRYLVESRALVVADLDGDNQVEVLHGHDQGIHILDGVTGLTLWTSPAAHDVVDMRVVDVDGDNTVEIVVLALNDGVYVYDGITRALEWSIAEPAANALGVGDADADLDLDVVIGTNGGALLAYDGATQAPVFASTIGAGGAIYAVAVADLDGDLVDELLATQMRDTKFSTALVLRASDRAVLWESPLLAGTAGVRSSLIVADADDDGQLEIVVGTKYDVRVFEYADGPADVAPPSWSGAIGVQSAVPIALACCPVLDLSWEEADDDRTPPVEYHVYRDTVGGFVPSPANRIGRTGLSSFRDTGVLPQTNYHYVVRAIDRSGNEDGNTVEVVGVAPSPLPAVPPVVTSVVDLDPCEPDGVRIEFSYSGDPTGVQFDLLIDGALAQTDITSPFAWPNPIGYMGARDYTVRASHAPCHDYAVSTIVTAPDPGSWISAPVLTAASDRDPCVGSGIDFVFSHGGFATVGRLDLVMDGAVVASDILSPLTFTPPDAGVHSYTVRAVEIGCPRELDSTTVVVADDGVPIAPVIASIDDLDLCAAGPAQLNVTHAGFASAGHLELWRDGVLFLSPVTDGMQFSPGDTASHSYEVHAVNDLCAVSAASPAVVYADAVNCFALGEPTLFVVKGPAGELRMEWSAASGSVAYYNLYPGNLDDLRATTAYTHQKTLVGAGFPSSPTPTDGCDFATGPGLVGDFQLPPSSSPNLYFLLVAADAGLMEGPYGFIGGVDIHDPAIDPRPATLFCN